MPNTHWDGLAVDYGKGFANEGGFVQWINGSHETIEFAVQVMILDELLDYKLAKLSIDFIIRNLLEEESFAYISISFTRNYAGEIEHELSYVPIS